MTELLFHVQYQYIVDNVFLVVVVFVRCQIIIKVEIFEYKFFVGADVMDLDMKIQYKNRTYKQTNWPCCDCVLAGWNQGLIDCPPFAKTICHGHGFKRKLFNDAIFKL